jgi:hypothetical protein
VPNTFVALDVPATADGVGAPTSVAATGHPKSLVLAGPVSGRYVVEGSNDGGRTWDILIDDNDGTQALFTSANAGVKSVDLIVEQVRVRTSRVLPAADRPTLTLGAPPALGANFFSRLDVPAAPGLGAVLDLGLSVGPLKTFILRGPVPPGGRFTILASMDGLRFDEAMLFTADQQGARSVSVMCRFLRVRRAGAAGAPPIVSVGAEPAVEAVGGGGGGGLSGPFVSFGDESAKSTSGGDAEEVLEEFAFPSASNPGAAHTVVAAVSALARRTAAGAGAVTIRLRSGGLPGRADGDVLVEAAITDAAEQRISGKSAPVPRSALGLVKVTGQGNGEARPVIRGLVVSFEPALGGTV